MRISYLRIISFILIISIGFINLSVHAVSLDSLGLVDSSIKNVSMSRGSNPVSANSAAMEMPIDENSYILGPGDALSIHIIVGDADLTLDHELTIGADGKIFFPNIGEIYLSGLSIADAKKKIDSKIKSVYKEKYKMSLLLKQPKMVKIYLTGMVRNPGPLSVYDNLRVSEVIAKAGGVVSGASNRYIYIYRKSADGGDDLIPADLFAAYRNKDISKDIRVHAGDVIEVPDADNMRISQNTSDEMNDKLLFEGHESFVYVYGEVVRSGRFEYVSGKRLSDYISFAGGPNAKALLGSVTLTRQVEGGPRKYSINASDIIYNGDMQKDIEIYGGDVINVPGNFFYVSDFTSFANTVLVALSLYAAFVK